MAHGAAPSPSKPPPTAHWRPPHWRFTAAPPAGSVGPLAVVEKAGNKAQAQLVGAGAPRAPSHVGFVPPSCSWRRPCRRWAEEGIVSLHHDNHKSGVVPQASNAVAICMFGSCTCQNVAFLAGCPGCSVPIPPAWWFTYSEIPKLNLKLDSGVPSAIRHREPRHFDRIRGPIRAHTHTHTCSPASPM
jgi:hypothetical protein